MLSAKGTGACAGNNCRNNFFQIGQRTGAGKKKRPSFSIILLWFVEKNRGPRINLFIRHVVFITGAVPKNTEELSSGPQLIQRLDKTKTPDIAGVFAKSLKRKVIKLLLFSLPWRQKIEQGGKPECYVPE